MHGIRALSLDWYGTLVSGGTDRLVALLKDRVAAHRPDVTLATILTRREALIASLETRPFLPFRARDELILRTLYAEFRLPGDSVADAAALKDAHMKVTAYSDVAPFLARVNHLPRFIVSNADADMLATGLAATGIEVTGVVTSEAARAYKPSPAIFQEAARVIGEPASSILHVGDSFVADVEGAARAGCRTAWLTRTGLPAPEGASVQPDLVAASLQEVADALTRDRA